MPDNGAYDKSPSPANWLADRGTPMPDDGASVKPGHCRHSRHPERCFYCLRAEVTTYREALEEIDRRAAEAPMEDLTGAGGIAQEALRKAASGSTAAPKPPQ